MIFIILYNWTSISIGVNLKYLNTGFHSHGDTPKFGCFDGKSPDNKWIMNKGTPWYSYDLGHIHMPCWCSTQDQAINDPSLLDQDLVTQYFGNLWNSRGAMAPCSRDFRFKISAHTEYRDTSGYQKNTSWYLNTPDVGVPVHVLYVYQYKSNNISIVSES